jgi:hypothetical protein
VTTIRLIIKEDNWLMVTKTSSRAIEVSENKNGSLNLCGSRYNLRIRKGSMDVGGGDVEGGLALNSGKEEKISSWG